MRRTNWEHRQPRYQLCLEEATPQSVAGSDTGNTVKAGRLLAGDLEHVTSPLFVSFFLSSEMGRMLRSTTEAVRLMK